MCVCLHMRCHVQHTRARDATSSCHATQHNTAQHSTTQRNTAQHSATQRAHPRVVQLLATLLSQVGVGGVPAQDLSRQAFRCGLVNGAPAR
jgi:hypothetical protein